MPTITLLPTLCFSFSLFSFFRFCYSAFPLFSFCFLLVWCCFSWCYGDVIVVMLCYCARQRLLIYCLPWLVFTILSLNHFCLGVGVLLDHPLVCQLPSRHHLPVLVMPHPITRQRNLFCLFVHHGIPIRIRVGILSHYPSWHAPGDSNLPFSLLGGMSS